MANEFLSAMQGTQSPQQQNMAIGTSDPEHAQELSSMSMDDISNQAFIRNSIPSKLQKFIEMVNVAESLKKEELDEISNIVTESFTIDKESRHKWEEETKKAFDIIANDFATKNTPWEGAANIKHPMTIGSCIQFNARINPEIVKNDNVVEVRNMLPDDENNTHGKRAERLSQHMSYQLVGESTNWLRDTDKLMMMLPLMGVMYRKSYFNNITGKPETELCLPTDIVVNDKIKSLECAQRVTHLLYMTSNELIENMRANVFLEYSLDELTSVEEENLTVQSFSTKDKQEDKIYDAIHIIYEQHRYLDLDGDGYQEPYIVTIHKDSNKVLRIVARYDESSFEYNEKGKFTKINPTHYFTDYHFIPNPTGSFYSIGYSSLLIALNETTNSILNQLIDAGTLANRQSGFIGSGLRIQKGDLNFRPGEWKQLNNVVGTEISQNIVPLPIKEPSSTLFQLLGFLVDTSKNITAISSIMQGELPPPNTPAATVMALVEQGQQVYSSVLYRIYDSLKKEFNKLYNINKKYLKEEEYFPLAAGLGMISIEDYLQPNYAIFPIADPKLSSTMQRVAQAQSLLQIMDRPEIDNKKVLTTYLETLKIKEPEAYMVQEDPNAPPPPEVQLADAQKRNIEMDTACKLLDRELKALQLQIDETKMKSQSAYYGGQLAGDKVDSIIKLTELEREASQAEIEKAAQEEEVLTKGTQMQAVPPELHGRLDRLEGMISQMIGHVQQITGFAPQQEQMGENVSRETSPQIPAEEAELSQ